MKWPEWLKGLKPQRWWMCFVAMAVPAFCLRDVAQHLVEDPTNQAWWAAAAGYSSAVLSWAVTAFAWRWCTIWRDRAIEQLDWTLKMMTRTARAVMRRMGEPGLELSLDDDKPDPTRWKQ